MDGQGCLLETLNKGEAVMVRGLDVFATRAQVFVALCFLSTSSVAATGSAFQRLPDHKQQLFIAGAVQGLTISFSMLAKPEQYSWLTSCVGDKSIPELTAMVDSYIDENPAQREDHVAVSLILACVENVGKKIPG